jgi:hypothetical protein
VLCAHNWLQQGQRANRTYLQFSSQVTVWQPAALLIRCDRQDIHAVAHTPPACPAVYDQHAPAAAAASPVTAVYGMHRSWGPYSMWRPTRLRR